MRLSRRQIGLVERSRSEYCHCDFEMRRATLAKLTQLPQSVRGQPMAERIDNYVTGTWTSLRSWIGPIVNHFTRDLHQK
jgi:hypothetical protein